MKFLTYALMLPMVSLLAIGCANQIQQQSPDAKSMPVPAHPVSKKQQPAAAMLFLPSKQPGEQLLNCRAVTSGQLIRINRPTVLQQHCTLPQNVMFLITKTGAALDCRGASLRGSRGFRRSAINIVSNRGIKHIDVRNCHVTGYGHALHIRHKTAPRTRYLRGDKNPDVLRQAAPQHISVTNLTSDRSINSAIFIGDHVHHVTMNKLTVRHAGTVGIYFEFGSRHNVVKNSTFVGNGHRRFKPNREAIAIDSSQYNRIENNRFRQNGAGAVFLYRNCFEHAADNSRGNHFLRTESSDHNIISKNQIEDEAVGVWVASRQSRDMSGFKCGAFQMKKTLFATYHEDAAEHNLVSGNTFKLVKHAVVVEDDNNRVVGNRFVNVAMPAITVGSRVRAMTQLGAVKQVTVTGNEFLNCRGCQLNEVIHYRASEPSGQCGNKAVGRQSTQTDKRCP